jgi:biotin-(acetyl-CoA carboxylase) ligase
MIRRYHRIGTLTRPSIVSRIPADVTVYLKWPNDVLIEDKKVCGVLIEVDSNRMLIGIGCNIGSAPMVDKTGSQAGRPSICLAEHNPNILDESISSSPPNHLIAIEIIQAIKDWLKASDSAARIIDDFQLHMDFRPQRLRDSYDSSATKIMESSLNGELEALRLEVMPLRINLDGTLQVRYTSTGEEKALVADYLF